MIPIGPFSSVPYLDALKNKPTTTQPTTTQPTTDYTTNNSQSLLGSVFGGQQNSWGSLALGLGSLIGDWISKGVEREDQLREQKYQHDLQQQIFDREDTSYQRAVADIKASGLGLSALSGGANSGAVVSTRPVESNQFQALANISTLIRELSGIENLNLQNQLLLQDQSIKEQIMQKNNAQLTGLELDNTAQALANELTKLDIDNYSLNAILDILGTVAKFSGKKKK